LSRRQAIRHTSTTLTTRIDALEEVSSLPTQLVLNALV
jgi:hypothetical protein